jgi:hypothetical protein
LTIVLVASVASFTLAACGAGEEDPREEVTETLRTALTTSDPALLCGEVLSGGLVDRVYGSAERCQAVESGSAGSRRPPASVAVSGVEVDGDAARASVTVRGGSQDGVRGGLSLVREDGRWRVDDLSTGFLRSSLDAGLSSGGSLEDALVSCVGKAVVGMEDEALRALALGVMGGRAEAQAGLRGLVEQCVRGLGAPAAGDSA